MKFIRKYKWLLLATLICTAIAIAVTANELETTGTIVYNSKFVLPFMPVVTYMLGKTIEEFIEEVF